MASGAREPTTGPPAVPPPQRHLQQAAARALEALRKQPQPQLEWLGARRDGKRWRLPVLDDLLAVEPDSGEVRTASGEPTGPWWRILTLHYLCVPHRPDERAGDLTFADLPGGRSYASVYRKRVIDRLCLSVGRTEQDLRQAGDRLGARIADGGDLGLDFQVYPRVRVRLVWYAGDEELTPSAAILLPGNIESFFCLEDIVVLSERLVSRLSGGRF